MRDTVWICLSVLIAWASMMAGLYLIDLTVASISGSVFLNVLEVLITVALFLLWLFLWRYLTLKLFQAVLSRKV